MQANRLVKKSTYAIHHNCLNSKKENRSPKWKAVIFLEIILF